MLPTCSLPHHRRALLTFSLIFLGNIQSARGFDLSSLFSKSQVALSDSLNTAARHAYGSGSSDQDSGHHLLHAEAHSGGLGAVASESAICSRIGTDILTIGGNAADSMVATTLCVGVIGMYHSGIGGGGFMLVRGSNGSYEDIDFRETAPAAAFEEMYRNRTNTSIITGLAAGVPGEVRGLAHLHDNYGVLPWEDVVMPAVHVAREGFPVTQDLVNYMARGVSGGENFLVNDPSWAIDLAPNGTLLGLGDTITRRRYADTLQTIAKRGPDAFYSGPLAQALINSIQATNGTMTMEDLRTYSIVSREPAAIDYRDYKIWSSGAPSSGPVAMSVMKIIEGYETIGQAASLNLSTHLFDEALRFAYGQRSEMGDPAYVKGMQRYQAEMFNASTAAGIRKKISPQHTLNVSAYDPSGFESLDTPGTSAIVTSDASGLTVALTTTINLLFGNKIVVPETGVILNNEMNDFSIPGASNAFGYIPSPANYVRPGKRPLSSIVPAIVDHAVNGSFYFATSAAGGSHIITAVLQQLWHVLDHNLSAPDALARPRLHDQLIPNVCAVEWTFDNSTVHFLRDRGHNVTVMRPGFSSAQSVRRLVNGTFEAASEPRQKNSGGFVV